MTSYCHHCGVPRLTAAAFCHTCGGVIPAETRDETHVPPHTRAAALARTGHLDQAIAAYDDIIAHEPTDPFAYVALATLRIATRHGAEAESLLREALALDPECSVAWAYLGALLLERVAIAESEDAFMHALTHGPEEFLVRLKRGEAMLRLGRTFDALVELTHAVMLDAPDKRAAAYARHLLNATRAQAARSAPRCVGTLHRPRRLVRWMSADWRETEVAG
ncbi:MAG: tetratricopeptide repeat protein [Chloroflexota bacterium]|nr:tetratricopeptide repeat protein [Chloroflexota bacterium]